MKYCAISLKFARDKKYKVLIISLIGTFVVHCYARLMHLSDLARARAFSYYYFLIQLVHYDTPISSLIYTRTHAYSSI